MFNHRHLEDSFLTFSTCMVIPVIPSNPRAATDNLSNIPALDMSSPVQALSTSKLYHQPAQSPKNTYSPVASGHDLYTQTVPHKASVDPPKDVIELVNNDWQGEKTKIIIIISK